MPQPEKEHDQDLVASSSNQSALHAFPYYHDEISLVDLAVTLVNQFKLLVLVILVLFVCSAAYIQSLDDAYEIKSILELGISDGGVPIEDPTEVQVKLNNGLIPAAIDNFKQQQNKSLDILAILPAGPDRNLVQLTSIFNGRNPEDYLMVHEQLLTNINNEHNALIELRKEQIKAHIEELEKNITSLEKIDKVSSIEKLYQTKIQFHLALDSIKNGKISVLAQQSTNIVSKPKLLLYIACLVASIVFALIFVFLFEFGLKVKEKIVAS